MDKWLEENPPPELEEMINKRGGYHKITALDWAGFDRTFDRWQQRRLFRLTQRTTQKEQSNE